MPASPRPRVLIVDSDTLARRGLCALVAKELGGGTSSSPWATCVHASSAAAAIALASEHRPFLAVVDPHQLPDDGFSLLRDLPKHAAGIRIATLTHAKAPELIRRTFSHGALGYALKSDSEDEIRAVLTAVAAGHRCSSPRVNEIICGLLASGSSAPSGPGAANGAPRHLSDRELVVYRLLGTGLRTADVAAQLNISRKTVETHCEHLRHKLQHATMAALRHSATRWVEGAGQSGVEGSGGSR